MQTQLAPAMAARPCWPLSSSLLIAMASTPVLIFCAMQACKSALKLLSI
ncbi:hypothetical protein [Janthinobacterium rivuli]